MISQGDRNTAASVHQRLLNIARNSGRPFNEILQYFAMERLLYRLSCSEHKRSFVLKGALLFRVWDVPDTRATRDIDFLAFTDNSPENLQSVFKDICSIDGNDGLLFDPESVNAQTIKKDADYEGVRLRFAGTLGNAKITMQVDVGFGDIVHPKIVQSDYPVLLDLPAPSLRMYPPESVVAEKVEAMLHLGSLNSRMKDFYDIWRIARQFEFDPETVSHSIAQTLKNRRTRLIQFDELKSELVENDALEKQWAAFLTKTGVIGPDSFHSVLDEIGVFLTPLFQRIDSHKQH